MKPLCAAALLATCACDMVEVYERRIERASRAIETATTDARRAAAYSERGRGYSDKARLLLFRKAIDHDEYVRLFDLAIGDHDRAVALAPGDAAMYFERGLSYYDRAALANEIGFDHTRWFDAARADFTASLAKDPGRSAAWDYLGLVDEQTGRFDDAVADYTHEMALDPRLGRSRLAELYCNHGQASLRDREYEGAKADLERSVELGAAADGCSCDPYNSLAYIYIEAERRYDKGWDLVRRAQRSGRFIAPEYVEKLKQAS